MPPPPRQRDLFGHRAPAPAPAFGPRTRMQTPPAGRAIARALRRRGWIFLPCLAAGLAGAWGVMRWRQPIFRATAQVQAVASPPEVHFAQDATPAPADPARATQSLAETLGSRAVMAAALQPWRGQPVRWENHAWRSRPAPPLDPVAAALRQLQVAVVPDSSVIALRFDAPDRAAAATVLAAVLQATAAQAEQRGQAAGAARVRYLDGRVAAARAAAVQGSAAAAATAAQFHLGDPELQLSIANQRWQQLAASETSADIAAMQQSDALQAGAFHITPQDGDAANIAGDPVDLQVQRAQAAAEVSRLAAIYRPQAPPLAQARQKLASLDASLAALQQQAHDERQRALDAARRQSGDLNRKLAAEARQQARLQQAASAWELAQAAYTAGSTVYSNLLDQWQQALAEAEEPAPAFTVMDPAFAPAQPVWPQPVVILASAVILAGLAGGLGLWAWERRSDRLRRAEAAEIGPPLLAVLPRERRRREYAAGVNALATSLLLAQGDTGARVVVVAGIKPREGKTSLTVALARQLAPLSPAGVLIFDGDWLNPQMHARLGGGAAPGLIEVLAEQSPLAPAVRAAGERVWYVAAGDSAAAPNATMWLASGAAADLLTAARARYDWVLVDAGAATERMEPALWAGLADAVVVLAAEARASRREVRRVCDRLESSGIPLCGLVLTQLRRRKAWAQPDAGWVGAPASAAAVALEPATLHFPRAS